MTQVWILNNSYFLHFVNPMGYDIIQPMIYPMILMIMPFSISRMSLLMIGFVLGLIMDIFCLSYGLHILACVVLANFRNTILRLIDLNPNLLESDNLPTVQILGPYLFVIYTAILVIIHHFVYFLLQSFTISSFLYNVVVAFSSSIVSIFIIFIWSLLGDRRKAKK